MSRRLSFLLLFLTTPALAQTGAGVDPFRKADLPPTGTFTLSLEYEGLFDRRLDEKSLRGTERDSAGVGVGTIGADVKTRRVDLESNLVYLRGAYSIYAPEKSPFGIEAYFLVGGADMNLDGDATEPGNPNQPFDVDGEFGIALGGGVRSRLFQFEELRLLADFSVRWSHHAENDIDKVSRLDLDIDPVGPPPESAEQDFHSDVVSWALALYASYPFRVSSSTIAPYAGIRFSGVQVDVNGRQEVFAPTLDRSQSIHYDGEQDKVFGIMLGTELVLNDRVSSYLELHFIDETSLSLGASYRF